MNDNGGKKVLIAVTEGMVSGGLEVLDEITAEDAPDCTDVRLVTSIFVRMWQVHHKEIEAAQKAKQPSKVLAMPHKPGIIRPVH